MAFDVRQDEVIVIPDASNPGKGYFLKTPEVMRPFRLRVANTDADRLVSAVKVIR